MPNQYTERDPNSQAERIIAFVANHPDCTSKDMGAHFGLAANHLSCILARLKNSGELESSRPRGTRLAKWRVADDSLHQVVTKSWEPTLSRCPLVAALFGAGPAQVAA